MDDRSRWRFDVPSSLLTLLVVAVGSFAYRGWMHETALPPTKKARVAPDLQRIAQLKVGTEGTLSDTILGSVAIGRTEDDYQAMTEAIDSGDDVGLREIIVSGRGFKVGNGNAAVLRSNPAFGVVEVQFAGGDHAGETGWASGDSFHPNGDTVPPAVGPGAPDVNGPPSSGGAPPVGGP